MENKSVGIYRLADKIAQTNGAYLYKAQHTKDIDSKDDFFYVVKEYCGKVIKKGALEREKKISHEIENYAPKSIVIPILDVLEENEKEYAVMQFRKNGMFLKELIEKMETIYGKGNIPIEVSLKIVEEILSSLEVLHSFQKKDKEIGYLHLDLHPGNIFLESIDIEKEQIGKVKFIDFFSALKVEERELIEEKNNKIYITSNYSSPEQLNRESYKYRPSTDLFSVGVIFLRMLLGELELNRNNCLTQEIYEKIQHFSENSVMNYAIRQFLKCCMEENPKYRYQSARAMLCAVEKLKRCHNAYKEQDYYTLFSIAYEMVIPEHRLEVLQKELNVTNFESAVEKLKKDSRQDHINVPKCRYLFEVLFRYYEFFRNKIPQQIKYNLLDSGIAYYNHTGDNWRTKELFEEIDKIKHEIPLMQYLGSVNRIAVMYADRYEFEKAYEIIYKNICNLEAIKQVYIEVAKNNEIMLYEESVRILDLARAYSAKGTYMVWTGRENPMSAFEQALQEFGNNIGNKMITISHILQYAIEMKDKVLYEKYEKEYFQPYQTIEEGLLLILKQDRLSEYALLTFLKGVYTFYIKDVTVEFQMRLVELLEDERLKKIEHPAQLIYKYIGLILYDSKAELEEVKNALYCSMTCIPQGEIDLQKPINIMMCMTYQTMWIYNELTEQEEENEELLLMMKEHCKNSGWNNLYEALEKEKSIKEILKYEHR